MYPFRFNNHDKIICMDCKDAPDLKYLGIYTVESGGDTILVKLKEHKVSRILYYIGRFIPADLSPLEKLIYNIE